MEEFKLLFHHRSPSSKNAPYCSKIPYFFNAREPFDIPQNLRYNDSSSVESSFSATCLHERGEGTL
ncbi:hypothetical protein GCWU000341_00071 [Oribacterium sp. oral taxon 078 str. F0262]|nr:hypothetical protein GCWU000341_00071 [Oribacterium sp. oral taxon 078 str. F0262]